MPKYGFVLCANHSPCPSYCLSLLFFCLELQTTQSHRCARAHTHQLAQVVCRWVAFTLSNGPPKESEISMLRTDHQWRLRV
uniref:Putative secreted protein n=1 Tax=Anopheles darlingi TaxID=43151 RepID=A0A2M4DRB1_ANODA